MIRAVALLWTIISCILAGAGAWWLYWMHLEHGQDWMVFYTAARAYFDGNLSTVLDGAGFMAALNGHFATWLMTPPLPLHPWIYPPHFLTLFLAFGALPPVLSYVSFLVLTFLGLMFALRLDFRHTCLFAASIALSPAAAFAVAVGQNSFLMAALLIGGFACMERLPRDRKTGNVPARRTVEPIHASERSARPRSAPDVRPILAGVLFGLLSFKPQFCLMVPVALVAASQWRVLGAAAVTVVILCLISLAMFGSGIWTGWLSMMTGRTDFFDQWAVVGRLNGMSVYACANLAGVSQPMARLAQLAAVLFAAMGVMMAFRREMPRDLRFAVLLTGAFLAAPHVSTHDAVLLTVAATFVFRRSFVGDLPVWHMPLAGLVWLCPVINPPAAYHVGIYTPLLVCLFLIVLAVPGAASLTRPVGTPRGSAM